MSSLSKAKALLKLYGKKMTSASSQLLHELLPATDNWKPDKIKVKLLFQDIGHQQQKNATVTKS